MCTSASSGARRRAHRAARTAWPRAVQVDLLARADSGDGFGRGDDPHPRSIMRRPPGSRARVRAISQAHSRTSTQGRKSPSGARTAVTMRRSLKPRARRSSLPAKLRYSRAPVLSISACTSAGSSSGFGGSPAGRWRRATRSLGEVGGGQIDEAPHRLHPAPDVDRAAQDHGVVLADAGDVLRCRDGRLVPRASECFRDGVCDLRGGSVP